MEVIKLENVTRYYQVGEIETPALRGVDLVIEDGEFSAVVGPSGSGKTTLLQLMGCLDKPSGGRIFIKGDDVTQLNPNQRADIRKGSIGFIFQFFALIPGLTAYENVEMPLLLSGVKRETRRERVNELLEAVYLSDRSHHRPDQMSGGEQQRVAIARALSTRPAVVLADEPTANLDGDTGRQVMAIMERLNKETGTTFFFATHDPRVLPFVHRTIVLKDGLISENSKVSKQGAK
jgi:putative ABC transport system ATP-binding protein